MDIKPEDLLFAKEAADYLSISPQRLYQLVNDGQLVPFKRSSSGMVFLVVELERRKKDLSDFARVDSHESVGRFKVDTPTKREALNFALMIKLTHLTENPLYQQFRDVWDSPLCSADLSKKEYAMAFASKFDLEAKTIMEEYRAALKAFSTLRSDDTIIKIGDMSYPPLLAKTAQAPRFLYLRGDVSLLQRERAVSIVGSRHASDKSKDIADKVARILCKNGIVIVSGLARGIDVSAHVGTLEANGRTIAVLGTPLNQYYPAENKSVQERIEKEGLVVSQFSPLAKTERWFFPLRDGVMSGLSLATIIIEAGETSGALKQAEYALKQGRHVLIPSSALRLESITWPRRFIERGAKEVTSVKHILENLASEEIFVDA